MFVGLRHFRSPDGVSRGRCVERRRATFFFPTAVGISVDRSIALKAFLSELARMWHLFLAFLPIYRFHHSQDSARLGVYHQDGHSRETIDDLPWTISPYERLG